jgi:phosphate-selective porin OprO/OprP
MQSITRRLKSWRAIVLGFGAVTLGGFLSTAGSEGLPPQNGLQIQSPDTAITLKFRGLLQADSRQFVADTAGNQTSQFLIRRARPMLEGTVYEFFSFLITPELASNAKTALLDAYLDIAPWSFAKLRAGKFKPPIGVEHLQSDANVILPERGLPSNLVPSRDTGVQFFGEAWNGAFGYALAFTNGVGDNNVNTTATAPVTTDGDVNDGKEGTVRLVLRPFKNGVRSWVQGLGIGLAGSYARQNPVNPTYISPGQISLLSTAVTAIPDGEKIRWAPDVSWYYRSLGVYGEFVHSSQGYRVGATRFRVANQAWQAAGSYVLTGEDASYNGVKPRKPFNPKNGTWGAWELAARYGQLYLDPDNFTRGVTTDATGVQRTTAYGVGINWYLNNAVRFTTGYDQSSFDRGAAVGDRPAEKVVTSRWQLAF